MASKHNLCPGGHGAASCSYCACCAKPMKARQCIFALLLAILLEVRGSVVRDPPGSCGTATERLTKLCGTASPKGNVCTVGSSIVLDPRWLKCEFELDGVLHLEQGASVACANQTERCAASHFFGVKLCGVTTCELSFKFSYGITLSSNAQLRGGTVLLSSKYGRISIAAGAQVDVSEHGLCGRDDVVAVKPFSARVGLGDSGAGHGGAGGGCDESSGLPSQHAGRPYGDATDVLAHLHGPASANPEDPDAIYLYGSGSALSTVTFHAPQQCCGGGLVVVNASQGLQLDGRLLANAQAPCTTDPTACPAFADQASDAELDAATSDGLPCCDAALVRVTEPCQGLGGASGGTIAVIAGSGVASPLNGTGVVSARGGDGSEYIQQSRKVPTAGGAGGRVLLPLCSVLPDGSTSVRGGYSSDDDCGMSSACECGAAGTTFYTECDTGRNRLIVDNGGLTTTAGSYVSDQANACARPVDDLHVINGAELQEHPGRNVSTLQALTLKENSRLRLQRGQALITQELVIASAEIVGSFEMLDEAGRSSMLHRRRLLPHLRRFVASPPNYVPSSLSVGSLTMDPLSKVADVSFWQVSGDAKVQGHIEVLSGEVAMQVGGRLTLDPLGSISAVALTINASHAYVQGHVESTRSVPSTCPAYTLDCSDKNLSQWPKGCAYPLRLDIDELTVLSDGVIAGGAMRICARKVTINDGQITASVLGHSAGFGPTDAPRSHGCVAPPPAGASADSGAGSGAAHGGRGGSAAEFENVTGCAGGLPYDDPFSPGDMGAGGGGEKGGQGGGVLHLSASESLELDGYGHIAADGADAAPAGLRSLGSRHYIEGGSGGGSGGSIFLEFAAIMMSPRATIHAKGGNGAAPGGGGGGGGLIRLKPPSGMAEWPAPLSADLLQLISANAGVGGGSGGVPSQTAGSDGGAASFVTANCTAGHGGPLCIPCRPGTFKRSRGSEMCSVCDRGTVSGAEGSTSCDACTLGTVALQPGEVNCTVCPIGSLAQGTTNCTDCMALGRDLPRFAHFTQGCEWQCEWPRMPAAFEANTCVLLLELLLPPATGGSLPLFAPSLVTTLVLFWIVIASPALVRRAHAKATASDAPAEVAVGGVKEYGLARRLRDAAQRHCRPSAITEESESEAEDRAAAASSGGAQADSPPPHGGGAPRPPRMAPPHDGQSQLARGASAGASALSDQYSEPFLRTTSRTSGGRSSPTQVAPPRSIESLRHALMWETHKYRAKQHVLRVYLAGWNTAMHPWRLPRLTPELRLLVSESAYWRVSEQFARAAEWEQWEVSVHSLLWLLPPLAVQFNNARRRIHWNRVNKLMRALSGDGAGLWRSMYSRVWEAHRLELGCSHEFTLGWVDIFANLSAQLPAGADAIIAPPHTAAPSTDHPCEHAAAHRPRAGRSITAEAIGADAGLLPLPGDRLFGSVPPPHNSPAVSSSATCNGSINGGAVAAEPLGCSGSLQQQLARQPQLQLPASSRDQLPSAGPGPASQRRGARRGRLQFTPEPTSPASAINLSMPPRSRMGASGAAGPLAYGELGDDLQGGSWTEDGERAESTYEANWRSYRLAEPRVVHEVLVCGFGTFLSPYWLEVDDFFVYDALSAALDASAATVAACINLRLRAVCYHSATWRQELRSVVALLDYINAQQGGTDGVDGLGTGSFTRQEPLSLALVRAAASTEGSTGGPSSTLVLLLGTGQPSTWAMPEGSALLTPELLEELPPPAGWAQELPRALDLPMRLLFGTLDPMPHTATACVLLVMLLVTELFLSLLISSGLCQLSDYAGSCATTMLCLPLAGLLSPFAGFSAITLIVANERGVKKAREKALRKSASGRLVRRLQLGSLWNAISLLNALFAQLFFVPFAEAEGRSSYHVALLPTCLIITKLCAAQAFKALAASVGVDGPVWAMLSRIKLQEMEQELTAAAAAAAAAAEEVASAGDEGLAATAG